jgi:hypothetical protein
LISQKAKGTSQMFDEYDDSDYHFNAHYDFIAILREENKDNFSDEEYERDQEPMVPYLKGSAFDPWNCSSVYYIPF